MKFLLSVLGTLLMLIVLWLLGVNIQKGVPSPVNQWVKEAYELKENYAYSVDQPKVLIVSGSSSLFGFNSPKLAEHWDMPVVNMGTHAGLGVKYILNRSKRVIKPGDIVLLPLELSFYQTDSNPSEVLSDFVIAWDEGYFDKVSIVDYFLLSFAIGYERFFTGFSSLKVQSLVPTSGVYSIQNMNAHGDKINLEPEKMTPYEYSMLDSLSAGNIVNSDLSAEFESVMQSYIEWASKNNICLIAVPVNYMFYDEYNSNVRRQFYSNIKNFYLQNNVQFTGSFFDYMYDKKYHFNSNYHLNSVGIQKRTKQSMKDLGKDIADNCL